MRGSIRSSVDEAQLAHEALARGHIGFALYGSRYYLVFDPYLMYQYARRSLAAFEQAQSTRWRNLAFIAEATALEALGEYATAERMMRASLTDALARSDLLEVATARLHLLFLLTERCRPEEIAEALELASHLSKLDSIEVVAGNVHGALARVFLAQGRLPEAQEAAEKALSVLQTARFFRPRVYRTLIELHVRQGRATNAVNVVQEVKQYLQLHGGAGRSEVLLRVSVAEAHVAAGDLAAARASIEETLSLIEECAQRIPDPMMRERYQKEVLENIRAQELARTVLDSRK